MPTIDITATTLHIRFTGPERVAGLLRDQHLPLTAVTSADVVPDGLAAVHGLRAPGLGLPGFRKIGTWRRRHGRSLVVTRRGRPALRVRLTGQRYEELLLDVAEPERAAAELSAC